METFEKHRRQERVSGIR